MAKRHQQQPRPIDAIADRIVAKIENAQPAEAIEWYRQCPLCWGRCQGVGIAYSTQGSRRYYRCARSLGELPPCGHTWTAIVDLEVIRVEHRTVTISQRAAAD